MAPLTPLGKPLSQQPLVGEHVATSSTLHGVSAEQPVTAWQWVSLARATWTWLIRPLWYMFFKWPSKLLLPPPLTDAEYEEERRRQHEEDIWQKEWRERNWRDWRERNESW